MARLIVVATVLVLLSGVGWAGEKSEDAKKQEQTNAEVSALRERLNELEAKLATLNEKYTNKHPLVIATKAEVDEVQANLRLALMGQQVPRPRSPLVLAPAHGPARKDLEKLRQDLEKLRQRLMWTDPRAVINCNDDCSVCNAPVLAGESPCVFEAPYTDPMLVSPR